MPLFYFDVYDGFSGPDRVGQQCLDHDAACREARRRAEELMTGQADWFHTGQDWQIGVVDAYGASLFLVKFGGSAGAWTMPPRSEAIVDLLAIDPKSKPGRPAPQGSAPFWSETLAGEIVERSASL